MRFIQRAFAIVAALAVAVSAASAQVVIEGNGTIIKGPKGGPYTVSRDGGRTWQPYRVKPQPVKLTPVPQANNQRCDFYQCGDRIVVVPAGTVGPHRNMIGTGVIDGRRVNPKTNVLR